MHAVFQESSASLEVQGSSKLKIQINKPRFKKGEVFFYCIPIIIAACFAPHVRPARLPLAFAARLLCIVPCFSAIHVSRNRSTQRLKRDEF